MSNRLIVGSAFVAASFIAASAAAGSFTLTILHNNDGESQLINAGSGLQEFGGVARFKTLVDTLRSQGEADGAVVMISCGDNFLAGPEFNASLANGVPFYDSIAMDAIGYDAICIGNHELDFGPSVLADFVSGFSGPVPFVSSNLDFTAEAALQALVKSGAIASRVVVEKDGRMIGLVGATTPDLPFISSPGGIVVSSDLVNIIQAEVDACIAEGADIVILTTHLQGIGNEFALVPQLTGVDVVVAGGGSELLANPGTPLVPDDAVDNNNNGVPDAVFGAYPQVATDGDGNVIPIVTTRGDYRYLGRLVVEFDADGGLIGVDPISGPVRVAAQTQPGGVASDPLLQQSVVDPVAAAVAALAANVIAVSEVPLDGASSSIRTKETNLGNLVADSTLWQAQELAALGGLASPDIAIQNGGGIRNNSILPIGSFTELDTFSILPFANFLVVIPDVPATTLKAAFENALSRVSPPPGFPTGGTGRFAQIAGMTLVYEVDVAPGQRVRTITLDDGRELVANGVVVAGAPSINVATINFLANGGDQYPFAGLPFDTYGTSYQQALFNYVSDKETIDGLIAAAQYPVGGTGRIVRIDNPADLDNNSVINGADLGALLSVWGSNDPAADLNDDGIVDGIDLGLLLAAWS